MRPKMRHGLEGQPHCRVPVEQAVEVWWQLPERYLYVVWEWTCACMGLWLIGRAGQSRAGQGKAGQCRAGRGLAWRGGVGRDGAGRDGAGQGGAERCGAGRDGTGRGGTGQAGAGRGRAGRVGAGRGGAGRGGAGRRPRRHDGVGVAEATVALAGGERGSIAGTSGMTAFT